MLDRFSSGVVLTLSPPPRLALTKLLHESTLNNTFPVKRLPCISLVDLLGGSGHEGCRVFCRQDDVLEGSFDGVLPATERGGPSAMEG